MKRVLLTGATGFIGRHCIPSLLDYGYEVHAITSRSPGTSSMATWHNCDLADFEQCRTLVAQLKPSHLLHLAWYVEPGKYWRADENLLWVQASLNLLQSFRKAGGTRVVMAGTCAEYAPCGRLCLENETPSEPSTLYGVCKNSLREILEAYSREFEISSAWGRLFFPYGPYEKSERLIPYVINSLLRGLPAKCTEGDQIRDFIHVDDAALAYCALLDSGTAGTVNIASGEGATIRDVINMIGNKLGSMDLIELGASTVNPADPHSLIGDTSRLTNEVRWRGCRDLITGLDQTIAWWKSHPYYETDH